MGLSEHEQRVLEEMERALYQEDPRFATNIRNTNLDRPRGRRAPLMTVLLVLGIAGIIAGVALPQPILGVAGFVAALTGLYGVLDAAFGRRRSKSAHPAHGKQKPNKHRQSWAERAGERFDRRREQGDQ